MSLEEIGELEKCRSKVFHLEEDNSKLQRRVEIEFPNEVSCLNVLIRFLNIFMQRTSMKYVMNEIVEIRPLAMFLFTDMIRQCDTIISQTCLPYQATSTLL